VPLHASVILDVQVYMELWQWQHWQYADCNSICGNCNGDGYQGYHGPTGHGEDVCHCVPTHSAYGTKSPAVRVATKILSVF